MNEKYLVFDCNQPLIPFYNVEGHFNSKWLEFEKEEAIQYVNEANKKARGNMFYCLSISEHINRLDSIPLNEMDKTIERTLDCMQTNEFCNMTDELYKSIDRNINGFSLPIVVESNEEYIKKLQETLDRLVFQVEEKPAFKSEDNFINDLKSICSMVMESLELAVLGENNDSELILTNLLRSYINHEFGVSELDKCYAFRGIAPFETLHTEGYNYDSLMSGELSFFRGRTVSKTSDIQVNEIEDICSLPYSQRGKSNDLRFSSRGEICLYLGTTTYVCSQECRWDKESQDLYMAAFKFNENGNKLKILNLAISEPLINGIFNMYDSTERKELQKIMIKLFPIVIATSFTVKTTDEIRKNRYFESKKLEYLLTQRLIKAIQRADIDGVAYLSRQGDNDFQYPHGINLAIPMNDLSDEKEYSDLYKCFEITQPILVNEGVSKEDKEGVLCYINKNYPEFKKYGDTNVINVSSQVYYEGKSVFYGKTLFSKLDDYLINQKYNYLHL